MKPPAIPPGVRRALRLPANVDRLASELDDEVRFHLDQRAAELMQRGMSPEQAFEEARRRFGDAEELRDYVQSIEVSHMRRMRLREWWDGWMQDTRFATRQLRRAPGFFAIAVLTLALGIGATSSIFTVVRGVLLRPLPYPHPDQIVQVSEQDDRGNNARFSDPNFEDLRSQARSFAGLAQVSVGMISVSGAAEAVRTQGAVVSRDFFPVLRVAPLRGRLFAAEEQLENGAPAVVISHRFWQQSLGGADDALGKTLQFDGRAFTVVGIMPPTVDVPAGVDVWMPRELMDRFPSRTAHNWLVIGRLADGVTLEQARRDASAVARRLKQQYGADTWMTNVGIVTLQEQIVGGSRFTLLVLLAGSLLLLLIACANVVNLLIARIASRQGEVAVRVAVGAGRGRLIQQYLIEALLLSLLAAAFGVVMTRIGVRILLGLQPGSLPRVQDVRVDWPVLLFTIAIAMAAAVGMGMFTAWRGTRGSLRDALSESQRTQGGTRSSERVRRGLVVAQVAMAVVLLVATGLFAHSFLRLLSVDPGFRVRSQVVLDIVPNGERAERITLYDALLERFRAIPGVVAAGGVNVMPLSGNSAGDGTFVIMNGPDEKASDADFDRMMKDPARSGHAEFRVASPGYFEAMGIELQRGRLLEERDVISSPHVAVISASLARTRWPNEDPIGKTIQFGNMDGDRRPFTIVGIVGDVHEESLASGPRPTFYASYRQRPGQTWRFDFVLATERDPASTIRTARTIVRDLRPDLPPRVRTIDAIISGSVADRRFVLSLVGAFGTAALLLAALGVYSVISYLVAQRGREISIRVALGARSDDILRMVLRQGLALTATGIAIGAAASFAATRVVETMLYGVGARDPVAFVAVVVLLAVVAMLASWIPARRAARVQAMNVLRVG